MINIEDYIDTGKLFDGRYKILRALSTDGGTADVWLATDTTTIDTHIELEDDEVTMCQEEGSGMLVAIKVYRPKNALDIEGEQRFRDEFKIVYECRHENLLQPTSFAICEEAPYLVLPYCQHGSSERFIGQRLATAEIWKFILDVSSGLNRLHTNEPPIIHQDIKPANVLIDNSNNFSITDFGISAKRGGSHGYYYDDENSGTLAYMAPERFDDGAAPVAESDIWAFGATLCEILTGQVPFGAEGGRNQVEQHMTMPKVNGVPADVLRLIHACLAPDPKKRPTAAEIRRAALARQYPVKSKKGIYIFGAVMVTLALAAGAYIALRPTLRDDIPVKEIKAEPSKEETFEAALKMLNSQDSITVRQGFEMMDSLAKLSYVPALYEVAFTYGYFDNDLSVRRKDMLGIPYYPKGHNDEFMPKKKEDMKRSLNACNNILECNDSLNLIINAKAAYYLTLAHYNGYGELEKNDSTSVKYLRQGKDWLKNVDYDNLNESDKADVDELKERINDAIVIFNKEQRE